MTNEEFERRLKGTIELYESHIRNHSRIRKLPEINKEEAKQSLRQLFLEVVGESEELIDRYDVTLNGHQMESDYSIKQHNKTVDTRNQLRQELRSIINPNASKEEDRE